MPTCNIFKKYDINVNVSNSMNTLNWVISQFILVP